MMIRTASYKPYRTQKLKWKRNCTWPFGCRALAAIGIQRGSRAYLLSNALTQLLFFWGRKILLDPGYWTEVGTRFTPRRQHSYRLNICCRQL